MDCECNQELTLRYALEARQLTVRTNCSTVLASLCLSAVVMLVEGQRWSQHLLKVLAPSHWSVACPLPNHDDGYIAEDFDHLVDAPVHAGVMDTRSLTVREQPHELVLIGAPPCGWSNDLPGQIELICEAVCDLMQSDPPSRAPYQLVLQLLDQGYGGLEHDNASVMQFPWTRLQEPGGMRSLLQLIGHEYCISGMCAGSGRGITSPIATTSRLSVRACGSPKGLPVTSTCFCPCSRVTPVVSTCWRTWRPISLMCC